MCDEDGTEWEATCQRVVSESNLTAAADGVLLCIGPQHGDDDEEYHGQDDHASNIEVCAVQKYVNLVDLVKSFPTNIMY